MGDLVSWVLLSKSGCESRERRRALPGGAPRGGSKGPSQGPFLSSRVSAAGLCLAVLPAGDLKDPLRSFSKESRECRRAVPGGAPRGGSKGPSQGPFLSRPREQN